MLYYLHSGNMLTSHPRGLGLISTIGTRDILWSLGWTDEFLVVTATHIYFYFPHSSIITRPWSVLMTQIFDMLS